VILNRATDAVEVAIGARSVQDMSRACKFYGNLLNNIYLI
jgi:hypothetical protein